MGINQLPSISTNLSSFLAYQLFWRVRGHTIFFHYSEKKVFAVFATWANFKVSTRQYGKQFFASKSGKVLALPFQLGKVEEKVVHTYVYVASSTASFHHEFERARNPNTSFKSGPSCHVRNSSERELRTKRRGRLAASRVVVVSPFMSYKALRLWYVCLMLVWM